MARRNLCNQVRHSPERGFSQEGMALEGGFDRTYISMVERGVKSPTVLSLFKLAEFLNVKPSDLLRRSEEVLSAATRPKPKHHD